MPKELEHGKPFELTEAFWKKYKPDSVKETGLSGKLRDYEKELAKAEKLDADQRATPIDKSKAWGGVLQALHDLTAALPPVIAVLVKEKASHVNLKAALDLTQKQLKGKTHAAYTHAEQRKEQTWAEATGEQRGEGAGLEWLKEFPMDDIRSNLGGWRAVLGKFHELAEGMPGAGDFDAPLEVLRTLSRKGTLDQMTGARTFDSDVQRQIDAIGKAKQQLETAIGAHTDELRKRNELSLWLIELDRNVGFELRWWRTLKDSKPR